MPDIDYEYAYTLNLGYHDSESDISAALSLTQKNFSAALQLVRQTLMRAATCCLDVAAILERQGLYTDGPIIYSNEPIDHPAFEQVKSYLSARKTEAVKAALLPLVQKLDTSPADIPVVAPLTPSVLADAFGLLEAKDLRVGFVMISPIDYSDIRKFGRDVLDIETHNALLKTGCLASLWGARIFAVPSIPAGTTFVLASGSETGVIPEHGWVTISIQR